jgi:hypothetical protein
MLHQIKYLFFFLTLDVYKRKEASALIGCTEKKNFRVVSTTCFLIVQSLLRSLTSLGQMLILEE